MLPIFSLFFALFFSAMQLCALDVVVHGKSALLMNGDTGHILFEKEKDLLVYPASTTKIATALFVLEKHPESLSEMAMGTQEALATISPQAKRESNYRSPAYWLESDGGHMSIKKGEELLVKDLLYALLINSPNDAANVIAMHVGETIPAFMDGLNSYVKSIGLEKSYFVNPHGLHHPMHRTTAKEMALLACHAVKNPIFRDIVCRSAYTFPQTNLQYERVLGQGNRLIKRGSYHYSHAIGVKTGTTKAAGKCLVAAAEKNGRVLVAALFGYSKREELYGDAIKLFETAFAEKKKRLVLLAPGEYPFKGVIMGQKRKLVAAISEGLNYDFYPSEREKVQVHLEMSDVVLPVAKGEKIGELLIKNGAGMVLGREAIFAAKPIRPTFLVSMKNFVRKKENMALFGGVGVVLFLFRKRRKRR